MLEPKILQSRFNTAVHYAEYVALAKPNERAGWDSFAARVHLTPAQVALAKSFARRINVLVISGTWCGDCVQQCPILAAIAATHPANPSDPRAPGIDLRFIERNAHLDFADHFQICGGRRVPVAIFMNEDFDFVSLLGDKTLARLRRQAATALGANCPLPGAPVPTDEVAAVTTCWLDEFERVALLLRLSAKLRQRHGD
jgi:thiol-disulfide isomerase/thioredoxin